MNGASMVNGSRTVIKEIISCVHDTIHFRVSFSLLCTYACHLLYFHSLSLLVLHKQ